MVVELLRRAGLENFHLILNSVGDANCRPKFMAALKDKLATIAPTLCADCQRRATTNPLRVLDCKVPDDQAAIDTLPSILDHLCDRLPRALPRGAGTLAPARHSLSKSAHAWCAAWIITCAPLSRSLTDHWEPKTPS